MALIKCDFFSEVLTLSTSMTVILPQDSNVKKDKKYPTLYLLHGFSDDDSIWTRRTSIERYVSTMGLAVVMPQVHHSFYSNMAHGNRYWTFLTEELPQIARTFFPLSDKREENFVAGLSMGGYGAFKWALNFPECFATAASLSGTLDIADWVNQCKGTDREEVFRLIFGNDSVSGSTNDLFYLLDQPVNEFKPLLYQCCGTEDFLYENNLTFNKKCLETSYNLTSEFSPGGHTWDYWDEKIQDVLKWLPITREETAK